ncbi:helix-turn-helix domain-containing protein [Streptomyces capoamus]|uniref:helix-turn-helix domain-containing protein n=1 Tax=Streptomyces capoamus TaxID=68183 RepID=UPI003EB6E094
MTGRPITGAARIRLRERAARLYIEGATIPEVAQLIGRSYGTAHTLLHEAGVRIRPRGAQRIGGIR